MNIEWNTLRAINGDIKNGFEELVCQLARVEQILNKSKFIRVAAPDGGVEAYCVLSDNSEYGWQAKFFSSIGDVQWKQIDESFKTAVNKHPNLVKYYICTPLDREDPRIIISKGKRKGQRVNHLMDKWNEKVKEWKSYANSLNREIEFEYWGNSEIIERLNRKGNEGKLYYWFNRVEFSDEWFRHHLEESIRNLDKRYTPELNFDLPISKVFEGLSKDNYFYAQYNSYLDILIKNFTKAISRVKEENVNGYVEKIVSQITFFKNKSDLIEITEITPIDHLGLSKILEQAYETVNDLIEQFYTIDIEFRKEVKPKKYTDRRNKFEWEIEYFNKLNSSINDFIEFLNGSTVFLSRNPFMLLTGEAGIGKSHLLADIAKKREERNQPSILLLGQHFTTDEPWNQIKKLLHINCERDTFLASLNAKAETIGSRILILIDAINEGEGKKLWKNHIAGFISTVKKYPYLGIVFSVRTSYEKLLIPESLIVKKEIIKVVHNGFALHEYEASQLFFENYFIQSPSIPLLHPEFSNPLFLKLFCLGLFNKNLREIPDGYEGISNIISFYLDSINIKVSEKHEFPENLNLVQKVIKKVASQIAETENTYINFEIAFATITKFAYENSISKPADFFQDLISEGLITMNRYLDNMGNDFDGVYISYERFSDHLVSSFLIENYFDKFNPSNSFKKGDKLNNLIDSKNANFNFGIIEALSIQLPELTGFEFFEVAPKELDSYFIAQAFVDSIIWRKKETIHEKLKDYINTVVIQRHGLFNYFINTILFTASQPKHYFNSDFLHSYLMQYSMADRDEWWTQLIHNQYPSYSEEVTSIKRMIDWSWSENNRNNISDESIRLLCQTMLWFLTSSNRTLRDSTTKALICLLEERIDVLILLIEKFDNVNDRYILQRLYAVAYGCALRTNDINSLKKLGNLIFNKVFDKEYVVPDILLRDYARGIIEFAISKGHIFSFKIESIQPPFKSKMPKSLPSDEDIKKYEQEFKSNEFGDENWGIHIIIHSMQTNSGGKFYGDFGRYVFESAFHDWKEVNIQSLSNLAVKWIIEDYGYSGVKHGTFDKQIKSLSHDRFYKMQERIGKKYQWIAFYDLIARVSDNFICYNDCYSRNPIPREYNGPWEPYVRDIDPTTTIKNNYDNIINEFWWSPFNYNNWAIPNNDWRLKTDDLPNPKSIISVVDDFRTEWLVLEIHPTWTEPADIGKDKWENPHKDLWYQIRSYITNKEDHNKILKWSKGKNFMGRWMPECSENYRLFSREYYWSPACKDILNQNNNKYDWKNIQDRKTGKYISEVAVTTQRYMWEEQFDASKTSSISFYKPSEILFKLLDLNYSKIEGQLINKDGDVICFDPSTKHLTHSCLLVRKQDLLTKLEENELDIFWTVLGEKLILGGDFQENNKNGRLNISGVVYYKNGQLEHKPYFKIEE